MLDFRTNARGDWGSGLPGRHGGSSLRSEREYIRCGRPPTGEGTLALVEATNALGFSRMGRRYGDYSVLDKIGSGGMGEVYRARHEGLGNFAALKFISAI